MDNLSLFADSLQDLMVAKNIKVSDICKATGLNNTIIYSWLRKETVPNINSLIALADYFNCSIDYLCGRTEQASFAKPVVPSSFPQRLRLLIVKNGVSRRKLNAETRVSMSGIQRFLTGTGKPLLDNLIKLANYFDCSIDYLLGRSDNI